MKLLLPPGLILLKTQHPWTRLGIIEIQPPTEEQILAEVIARLESDNPLSRSERDETAAYLRKLLDAGILDRRVGAPRTSEASDIALDLLVCRELHGQRAASGIVSQAWGVSKGTAREYYSKHKANAAWRLSRIIGNPVYKLMQTRRELLEAIHADLQDRRARKKPIRKLQGPKRRKK